MPFRSPHEPSGTPDPTRSERRFLEALAEIRESDPWEGGDVAFLSRVMVQATLPYRDPGGSTYVRRNGRFLLTLQAPPAIGLPYGRYPRLVLGWLGREAVRRRSRELRLGESLTAWMAAVGVRSSGGRTGPLSRFKDQAQRLFATTISCSWSERDGRRRAEHEVGHRIASGSMVWWAMGREGEAGPGWADGGWVVLSEEFYEELLAHPVPVDARVLRALRAPLALDVYAWLTWRSRRLRRPVAVPWRELAGQFGTGARRVRCFREEVLKALVRVRLVYPEVRVEATREALVVYPAGGHVACRAGRS